MVKRVRLISVALAGAVMTMAITAAAYADPPTAPAPATALTSTQTSTVPVLYPANNAAVGKRVNVVLDPTTDWSTIPFFQVSVGATDAPVVDTSSGRHAVQGLLLQPGVNVITVKALSQAADSGKSGAPGAKYQVLASRTITVYNREGAFSAVPATYRPHYFHTREHEADCSGCHRLEAEPQDFKAAKPDDVLCFTCHRNIPSGKYVHGPAALWNCLVCHNPDLYPSKYQFTSVDPWQVTMTAQPVEPAVFTISADALFKPQSSERLSTDVPAVPKDKKRSKQKTQELEQARDAELKKRKEQERGLFEGFLEYVRQNPTDKVLVEAHSDTAPPASEKGKETKGSKTPQQLTEDRAKAVAELLKEYGITGKNRVVATGMGNTLPKSPNRDKEGKDLNNRIDLVVHPADVSIQNSQKLPVLSDRERVVVEISLGRGAAPVRGLKVVERLPAGFQYARGTALVRGKVKDPLIKGGELTWALGDPGADFHETISFMVRKEKGVTATASPVTLLRFTEGSKEGSREFDPTKPVKSGLNVKETCDKCHGGLLTGTVKHGPADAGACSLCHDPHGSNYPAWTRKEAWRLCTTCHTEKASDVHVIAGFVFSGSHPTRRWPDPSRPGKHLSCISCHSPHSGEARAIFVYGIRSKYELCALCHKKK